MHMSPVDIVLIAGGIFFLVWGALLFTGKTALAKKTMRLGNFEVNHELLGFLFFMLGIILLLFFIIPALGPRLSSPGLS